MKKIIEKWDELSVTHPDADGARVYCVLFPDRSLTPGVFLR